MDKTLLRTLDERTRARLVATEAPALSRLDEQQLVALHARVRRSRDKYEKLYRRSSSAAVVALGSRGAAEPRHVRIAAKAEAYEDALSRVSQALAVAAKGSAARLRAERLRRARQPEQLEARTIVSSRGKRRPPQQRLPVARRSPISRKRHAATRSAGARRQAKRDKR